jgi:hypothetical protein
MIKEKKNKWKKYLSAGTLETFEEYRRQRDIVKKAVQEAKKEMWENFGKIMDENYKENQKLSCKTLKSMRKGKECPLKFIYDQDKKLLTEPKKIMARWKNYFKELLEGKEQQDNDNENEEKEEHTETQENRSQKQEITKEEFKNAVKKMKLGKAAGRT